MPPPVIGDTTPIGDTASHEEDVAAIERIIADSETAYDTDDVELMTAPLADNAPVVNAPGRRLPGRDPGEHRVRARGSPA